MDEIDTEYSKNRASGHFQSNGIDEKSDIDAEYTYMHVYYNNKLQWNSKRSQGIRFNTTMRYDITKIDCSIKFKDY